MATVEKSAVEGPHAENELNWRIVELEWQETGRPMINVSVLCEQHLQWCHLFLLGIGSLQDHALYLVSQIAVMLSSEVLRHTHIRSQQVKGPCRHNNGVIRPHIEAFSGIRSLEQVDLGVVLCEKTIVRSKHWKRLTICSRRTTIQYTNHVQLWYIALPRATTSRSVLMEWKGVYGYTSFERVVILRQTLLDRISPGEHCVQLLHFSKKQKDQYTFRARRKKTLKTQ